MTSIFSPWFRRKILVAASAVVFWALSRAGAAEPDASVLPGPGGTEIACTIYPPVGNHPGSAGLVIGLYGAGGSHRDFNQGRPPYAELRRLLAERGYWLVIPELGPRHWMNDTALAIVDATIAAMIQREHVDPARVHLLGTSMGAGSSLIYVMKRPHRIKSVAAIFPMTDFARWFVEAPGYRAAFDQAHGLIAGREGAVLGELSPLLHPESFRSTPVFLLHGDRDTTVPPHHSREFAAALKAAGGIVIYREAPGETHRDEIARPYQKEIADFLTSERE